MTQPFYRVHASSACCMSMQRHWPCGVARAAACRWLHLMTCSQCVAQRPKPGLEGVKWAAGSVCTARMRQPAQDCLQHVPARPVAHDLRSVRPDDAERTRDRPAEPWCRQAPSSMRSLLTASGSGAAGCARCGSHARMRPPCAAPDPGMSRPRGLCLLLGCVGPGTHMQSCVDPASQQNLPG